MPRTRDLFLIVIAIVALSLAFGLYAVFSAKGSSESIAKVLLTENAEAPILTAETVANEKNKQETIDRLRKQIQSDNTTITPVLTTVSSDVASQASSTEQLSSDSSTTTEKVTDSDASSPVKYCATIENSERVAKAWPLSAVILGIETGDRVIKYSTPKIMLQDIASTSATDSAIEQSHELLRMRAFPVKSGTESCVPGEIVGITQNGTLVYNSDALRYIDSSADTLIGYARDGFPIYGLYTGEVDTCGGYQHVTGYRYTITKERSNIVSCFYAKPAAFTLP